MRDNRQWYENAATAEQKRMLEGLHGSGSNMDRKYWVALALYAVLAILVWFTMSADKIPVFGRPVDLRLVPLVVIGALALKTVLSRQAERIRRRADSESSEAHRGQV